MKLIETLYQEFQQLSDKVTELEQQNLDLRNQVEVASSEAEQRLQELAILTTLLDEREQHLQQHGPLGDKIKELNAQLMFYRMEDYQALLRSSELFDADWYLSTYTDVAQSNIDPCDHYLLHGANEGRNPSRHFDSAWYLSQNPDVQAEGINPLVHYLESGQFESRSIKSLE